MFHGCMSDKISHSCSPGPIYNPPILPAPPNIVQTNQPSKPPTSFVHSTPTASAAAKRIASCSRKECSKSTAGANPAYICHVLYIPQSPESCQRGSPDFSQAHFMQSVSQSHARYDIIRRTLHHRCYRIGYPSDRKCCK